MKIVSESREYSDDQGNVIKGVFHLNNSKIIFGGRDNFVFFNDVILNNCVLYLRNSKSLLYIEKNKIQNLQQFVISEQCNCIIRNGLTNGRISIRVGEGNLIIGKDCMFSQNIYIQNHDGHPIYDIETSSLLNPGQSIIIGDHVWIGESVSIMKGAKLGSGMVAGSKAFLANKEYKNNSIYAGIPAKELKTNIFWKRMGLHVVPIPRREEMRFDRSQEFQYSSTSLENYKKLDSQLLSINDPIDRFKIIQLSLRDN